MAIRYDSIQLSNSSHNTYPVLTAYSGVYLNIQSANGYVRIGSGNTTYAHFTTDRGAYYFDKNISLDGNVGGYGGDEVATFATYYDSNDTSYYVDPAGTSNIHSYNRGLAEVAGWVPAYSNSNPDTVRWNTTEFATELQSSSDSSIGAAFKAIRVKSGQTIRITLTLRASAATSSGLYIRGYQYNGNLPDGKTHVSNSASYGFVQEDSSGTMSFGVENVAISTAWTTYEKEFLITADGYFSVVVLNWTGMGSNSLYLKTPTYDVVQFQQNIYYDDNNSSYYVDPASTSNLNALTATRIGVNPSGSSTTKYGISLYGGYSSGEPTYGLLFTGTPGLGTHGAVTSDWATYFTMNNSTTRGWIFRRVGSANVASISGGGTAHFNGDVVAYSSSDERLKDNKKNIENALEKVESLNGIEFDWNDNQTIYSGHDIGVIAQEVEKIAPEIVADREDGYKAVKYEKLVPLLIEAVKELSEKVKMLENK